MSAELGVVHSENISELEARLKLLTEQISEGFKQLNNLQHHEEIEKLKSISETYLKAVNSTLKQVEGLGKLKDLNLLETLSELNQLSRLDRLNKLDKLEELNKLQELVSLDRLHELKNLIFLEELKRLDKINELSKLEVIDRLDLTLNRHHETLKPLKHLDELEKLNSLKELKSLSQLEALKNLSHLDKIALLENLNKLDNLSSMASLDNLRHLSILDELKNLDELRKLQKLDDLDKLDELKNLNQLEKLNHLSKLDRIEDARFAERLNKLDKLDILKTETKKLALQQILGTGLDVFKLSLAVVIIILVLSTRSGQKIVSSALPLMGFSHSAQTSLGLQMLMGQIPDEQFEQILGNVKKKIEFEIDTLFASNPLPHPLERLALIKQLKAYDFSEFGSDLADDIKTKMDSKKNALNNQVIESLDFAIGIKKSEGNEPAERLLREVKVLIMNGKFMSALELSLPYWGNEKAMTLAAIVSIIEMEKESPELVENVLNRPLINKTL